RVLVAASDNLGDGVSTSEVYDPINDSWSAPEALNDRHCSAATTKLPDGRPLIVSGNNCAGTTATLSAEYFGSANVFIGVAPSAWPAYRHASQNTRATTVRRHGH